MHRSSPRRATVLSIAATSLALVASATGLARAQSAEAEALFAEAERLEAADDLAAACDTFEASNRLEPRAGTMIRLGDCRRAQGRLASAWAAYKDALARAKDPRKIELAEDGVADLEPRLSFLTISVPDDSRVDGLTITRNGVTLDPALWNRAVPVDGGTFEVAGRAPGFEAWTTTTEVATEADHVSIDIPRFTPLVVVPVPAAVLVDDGPRERPRRMTGRRKLAIGVGVTGVAALAVGGALLANALSLEAEAHAMQSNDLIDDAVTRSRFAYAGLGVGTAAVIGAAVLWLTGNPEGVVRF